MGCLFCNGPDPLFWLIGFRVFGFIKISLIRVIQKFGSGPVWVLSGSGRG